jgi:hypothetical protein
MDVLRVAGTRKVAAISMFTALAVATDYAMLPLANVKLMDSIVFVSALAFGLEVGVSVGALTWLVYGEINPCCSSSSGQRPSTPFWGAWSGGLSTRTRWASRLGVCSGVLLG